MLRRGLVTATGAIIADLNDELGEAIGATVERMVANCWSLGAALYLLAVWRWRIAHFDNHNDVSEAHHTASLTTRIRNGHRDVTRDFEAAIPLPISNKISEAICAVLGIEWTGQDGRLPRQGHCFLVATAGIKGDDATRCCSGTLVVKVYPATGAYVLQYVSSATYGGGRMTSYRAIQLGLLRGLRRCRAYRWAPIHVMGDNADVLRQLTSRTPPRAIHLKGDYWKTRRAADAAEVLSWSTQLREQNRTAQELARMAKATDHDLEWNAAEMSGAGTRWAGITGLMQEDVKQWLQTHEKLDTSVTVAGTV
ncbi:hypothetical protein PRIC1_004649 [Phytophthora ramorum]